MDVQRDRHGWYLTNFVPRFLGQRYRGTGSSYSTRSWDKSKSVEEMKVKEEDKGTENNTDKF